MLQQSHDHLMDRRQLQWHLRLVACLSTAGKTSAQASLQ